ncbi:MAG: HAD-IA family hydrolase [Methylophilaceae bacterium]|nr:HAD-IA family hydrolase [Methylophilaceae bacterium]
MPKRFELLVFDWDGTLADSARIIIDAIEQGSLEAGVAPPEADRIRSVIGLGLQEALLHLFPDLDEGRRQHIGLGYRRHYLRNEHQVNLFEGVAPAMREWAEAGFLLAVATGKGRRGLDRALEASGLGTLFITSRCADECFSKPHPQMLEEIVTELGVSRERALMIGDSTFDLMMAQNAGIAAVGVSYGAQCEAQLWPHAPIACFDSFAKLRAWLNENA